MVVFRFAARALALALALVALLCALVFGIVLMTKLGNLSTTEDLLFYGASAAVFATGAIVVWRRD